METRQEREAEEKRRGGKEERNGRDSEELSVKGQGREGRARVGSAKQIHTGLDPSELGAPPPSSPNPPALPGYIHHPQAAGRPCTMS